MSIISIAGEAARAPSRFPLPLTSAFFRGRYDDAIKQLVYGTQNEAYMPTPLIRLTRAIMPDYRYGTQQDAHEYLRLLLSAWAEDYGLKPEEFMQSPAYGCFAGCYSSWCRCLTCGEESRKYSADLDLSVEIMQFVDEKVPVPARAAYRKLNSFSQQGWVVFNELSECFRSYFKRSKLVGDNQVRGSVHTARHPCHPHTMHPVALP